MNRTSIGSLRGVVLSLILAIALGFTVGLIASMRGDALGDPLLWTSVVTGSIAASLPAILTLRARTAGSHVLRVRVALGGPPKSGKTVLATMMILCLSQPANRTREGRWTASSETELAVSQGERLLAHGFTSVPTRENDILHFQTSTQVPQSALQRLLNGPAEVELDIIDSAGELWQRLGREARLRDDPNESDERWFSSLGQIPLVESTYFARVAESHALVYLIGADDLLHDPERVRLAAIDAGSALRMLRVKRREQPDHGGEVSFMLVISKADFLDEQQARILNSLVRGTGEFSSLNWGLNRDEDFTRSVLEVERLCALADSLADKRGGCLTSSLETAISRGLVRFTDLRALDLPIVVMNNLKRRIGRSAIREPSVLDPLKWVLERKLGSRYGNLI